MGKWESGNLHSGSKSGPAVKSQKQAVAIMLSEKKAAAGGKKEYQPVKGNDVKPPFQRSVMGRKVIHNSPDQHPQQDDAPAGTPTGIDAILQAADQGKTSGTLQGSRKDMKPAQIPLPRDTGPLKKIGGY